MTKTLANSAKFLKPLANTNRDAELFIATMVEEKDAIARLLGTTPRTDISIDWYRGRLGMLQELLDGATGTNGNQ